jgi:hypothetical protein
MCGATTEAEHYVWRRTVAEYSLWRFTPALSDEQSLLKYDKAVDLQFHANLTAPQQ